MADADEAMEDDEAIMVAQRNDDEDEEAALVQKAAVVVRLFGESGETTEETSTSIHFYAMIRSMQQDKLLLPEVAASILTIVVQLVLLHGFIYAYWIGPSLKKWNSWHHSGLAPLKVAEVVE